MGRADVHRFAAGLLLADLCQFVIGSRQIPEDLLVEAILPPLALDEDDRSEEF